ncbi:signal transduction histidine kinase [Nocardiopsis mwathae]|uniref:histidine kinase n=1 Tax=Nocardiopsis mwathae TaxID=1472723 RepID=A0A7W9YG13_9ACTN|nr:histidine kinase [Nocardiopsis mwathae]MBB6171404.1 signal transduction histidine kinase [Nocardiopsis mwathae]
MFHGEEEKLRRAFGERPTRLWKWWWDRRYRFADWFYAITLWPWIILSSAASQSGMAAPVMRLLDGPVAWPLQLVAIGLVVLLFPALTALAILFRRTRPELLLIAAAVMLFVFGSGVAAAIALYSYAAWFSDRRRLAAWTLTMVIGAAVAYSFSETPVFLTLSVWIVFIALPLTIGLWVGTRRQLVDNLKERAERLEREQHLMADRAITAERTRIAREMHDVVAHRVSLMVLHAGGLEVSASDPTTVETAGLIRSTGREALSELREILGVLRDDPAADAPTAPQPVLSDLARLISEWRTAGMRIEWRTTGSPRPLPAQVERTAFRTVQEALTNAGKHAPGGAVTVRMDYGEDNLEIVVTNEPRRDTAGPCSEPPPSSGYGLAGLRERISLVGGDLSAGPYPDGGWQVRAILPVGTQESEETGERG